MPITNRVVQISPAAATLTPLYTVTAGASAICSTIVVANRSATPTSFSISVAPAGAADDPSQYLYYNIYTPGNDTFCATIGFALNGVGTQDVVRVYATLATLSFSLFVVETT